MIAPTRLQVLTKAVRTAIATGCKRAEISVPAWASSYSVSQKIVREIWQAELTKLPPNSESLAEGK